VAIPVCQSVRVFAFRGDRSHAFAAALQTKIDNEKNLQGPGPTTEECVLYGGHTGVSVNGGATVYGFNPDSGGVPTWQFLNRLKNGERFPGVVRDDTAHFALAHSRGLAVVSFEVILPKPEFGKFQKALAGERKKSQYYYGFPNGDGDCNCTTWLERLGLPLLTGRMDEFLSLPAISSNPRRRFGLCQ
jgi:hypothetical protein